jgi:hypothetical protein
MRREIYTHVRRRWFMLRAVPVLAVAPPGFHNVNLPLPWWDLNCVRRPLRLMVAQPVDRDHSARADSGVAPVEGW